MLQARLLGQFDVRAEGKRVIIPRRAGQSLFAFLILTAGTSHRREKLAGLLWPDVPDEVARRNLRQELWRVRKAVAAQSSSAAEYFAAEELSICFNPDSEYWLDVAQLEQATTVDDPVNQLINQLALYQGELLPGFYEDWVLLERERVEALFEGKMQQLMGRLIREERWGTCQEWAERWLTLGHAPEAGYRALMVAFAALGDRGKLVATFARCQQALENELSVKPSPETQTLYEQLICGAPISEIDLTLTRVASARVKIEDEPPAPGESPFKGLQYFDQADADLFFGRELLTAQLVSRICTARFLAVVVGASGSGKSSIIRAGLIPALRNGKPLADGALPPEGSRDWRFEVITPTAHPLQALAIALTRNSESVTATATLMDDLARDPRALHLFVQRLIADSQQYSAEIHRSSVVHHVLLVIDQFEELFALCRDELEREKFIDNLLTALTPFAPLSSGVGAGLTIVITLRADFYAQLAQYPELRMAVAAQQEYIGPMTGEELRRAIEEPARRRRAADGRAWEFETGLVDLILRDVGDEPGALPLLSHALLETWKRRRGRIMTLKGYAESGGVRGAIAQTADTVYASLSPEQQVIARDIFVRLTELGEGTEDTRRRAAIDELISQPEHTDNVRTVLTLLADARLVTTEEGTAQVAHEALIREWPLLREWLTADREGLRLHRHLTEAAHEWEFLERDPGALYRGARLVQAQEWVAGNARRINTTERAFLDTSIAESEREKAEQAERRRRELEAARKLAETETRRADELMQSANRLRLRNRVITAVGFIALLFALLTGVFGWQSNQNAAQAETNLSIAQHNAATAQANLARAEAQRLAAEANALLKSNGGTELIALLAIRAMTQQYSPEGDAALTGAAGLTYPRQSFNGHTKLVSAVAFSSDGKYVLTGSADKTARLWNRETGQELYQFNHDDSAFSAVFSPDSRYALTLNNGSDFKVRMWDMQTGEQIREFTNRDFTDVALFSPDGKQIFTGSRDASVRTWNVQTGKEVGAIFLPAPAEIVRYISSDGQYALTTAGTGNAVQLWKLGETAIKLQEFTYSDKPTFTAFALSPNDRYVLIGYTSGTVVMWDVRTGARTRVFKGHASWVASTAFSPDGKHVLTGSQDKSVRLWDADTGEQVVRLTNSDQVFSAAFSPEGESVLVGSGDGTVRLWDLRSQSERPVFKGHTAAVWALALAPDGKTAATGGTDGVRLWDTRTGELHRAFLNAGLIFYGLRFSPDGQYFLSGNESGVATLWNAESGQRERDFDFRDSTSINDVAFSPDGRLIAAGGYNGNHDHSVLIWDAQTGRQIGYLPVAVTDQVNRLAFSPDGQTLLTAHGDAVARLWNARSGQFIRHLAGHTDVVNAAAFSPDGTSIATASYDKTARLWDVETGMEIRRFVGHTEGVWSVIYSPDGRLLATSSGDGTARLWDVQTGQELRRLVGHTAGVETVVFSPDGRTLVTASDDGTARLWDVDYHTTIQYLCSRLLRDFTDAERIEYNITDHGPTCPK